MTDPNTPAATRLRAIEIVLEQGAKADKIATIEYSNWRGIASLCRNHLAKLRPYLTAPSPAQIEAQDGITEKSRRPSNNAMAEQMQPSTDERGLTQQPDLRAGNCAATEHRTPGGLLDVGKRDHSRNSPRPAMDHHATGISDLGEHLRAPVGHWTSTRTRGRRGELMPVFKRKYESGKTVWRYIFSAPGSTRQDRRLIEAVGFASKQEAIDAEAKRRTEELQKFELAKAGAGPVAASFRLRLRCCSKNSSTNTRKRNSRPRPSSATGNWQPISRRSCWPCRWPRLRRFI